MAFPTLVFKVITHHINAGTHTVGLPQSGDGVANGDALIAIGGRDFQSGTPAGPSSTSYGDDWVLDAIEAVTNFAQAFIFTCLVTDASAIPSTDDFVIGGNRKTEWWADAVNGADYVNREVDGKTGLGNMDISGFDPATSNDENLILGGASSQDAAANDPGDADNLGSWSLEHEDISSSGAGPDGGLTVCSITQALAGVLADQEIESSAGNIDWASPSIAFPAAAAAAGAFPPFRRRKKLWVRM